MRLQFSEQLDNLKTEMISMGALCESAIADSVKALVDGDMSLADKVAHNDNQIDEKERNIETICMNLLLRQQPVARDLRQISSALKMITDMERIGDQAADIAEITTMGHIEPTSIFNDTIREMARQTILMVSESIDAYVRQDLSLAQQVIDRDDTVDALFDKVKRQIIGMKDEDVKMREQAVDILMIAKYFERIGDHATNIAEWVEYAITGTHRSEDVQ